MDPDFLSHDPLTRFALPEPIRKHSAELRDQAEGLQDRIRQVSATSAKVIKKNDEDEIRQYINSRKRLASEVADCIRNAKRLAQDLERKDIDRADSRRSHKQLEELDALLLHERWALAKNSVKLEYGILGHPSHAHIGEAYLAALLAALPEPAGARLNKSGKREPSDQTSFRNRLRYAYYPSEWNHNPDKLRGWCPVIRRMTMEDQITAAHLVPYAIGELNVAYLFGVKMDKGYEHIWSTENGLTLFYRVAKTFDAGQLVIIPDDDTGREYRIVVLDDNLLKTEAAENLTYGELNYTRLEFRTEKRPSRRYLYLHYLLTMFRRRRFDVEGWEKDREKVSGGVFWGTPGPWLRRSIIKALAFELGDLSQYDDVVMNDAGLGDFPDQLPAEKEKDMAIEIRKSVETKPADEHEDEDED